MRYLKHLYFQVLLAIGLGVLVGWLNPELGVKLKPLGDGFIKLVKMLIAPIVFTTVVVGIAHMGEMKHVGRIGLRALVYFEVVSTVALAIGLIVVTLLKPGGTLIYCTCSLEPEEGEAAISAMICATKGLPASHPK